MLLEGILLPVSIEHFKTKIVDKDFAVVPGSGDKFHNLLPWSTLNSILNSIRIGGGTERLRLVKDGTKIPPSSYLQTNRYGAALKTGVFEQLVRDGATLVLDAIDELVPEIDQLTSDCESHFGGRVQANLYAGWRTQRGFDLHWDDHDTFILQIYGRKAWKVYGPTCEAPTKQMGGVFSKPSQPPVWDGILEEGSCLYMPRGWWHVATPMDDTSLHLTLGFARLEGDEIMQWLANELHRFADYRRYAPECGPPDEQRAYVSRLRELISATLSDDCLSRVLAYGDWKAPRRAAIALPGSAAKHSPKLANTAFLLAGVRGLLITTATDGQLIVTANGTEWTCSPDLQSALRQLNDRAPLTFEDLAVGLPSERATELKFVLTGLRMAGVVLARQSESVRRVS